MRRILEQPRLPHLRCFYHNEAHSCNQNLNLLRDVNFLQMTTNIYYLLHIKLEKTVRIEPSLNRCEASPEPWIIEVINNVLDNLFTFHLFTLNMVIFKNKIN